jgi:hypothetical protein
MPCCVLALLALFGPRLIIVGIWLFNQDYLNRVFDNFIVPLLGFILLPWTTLAYAFAFNTYPGAQFAGLDGTGLIILIAGFVIDLISYGGSGYGNRSRFSRA